MTVCVATVAARSKAIVLVADKAVTYESDDPTIAAIWAETDIRKIYHVGCWRALIAGDISFGERVVGKMNVAIAASPRINDSVDLMTQCTATAFNDIRDEIVESTILRPRLLTKDLYFNRLASLQPLNQKLLTDVETDVAAFRTTTTILICGFSGDGARRLKPHLFSISDPGRILSHDSVGFHAIGQGNAVALGRLLWRQFDRRWKLDEAVYHTFDAKAHAELVQSVGIDWDGEIVIGHTSKRIPDRIANYIGGWFDDINVSPFAKQPKAMPRRHKRWRAALHSFAEDLLKKPRVPKARTKRAAGNALPNKPPGERKLHRS